MHGHISISKNLDPFWSEIAMKGSCGKRTVSTGSLLFAEMLGISKFKMSNYFINFFSGLRHLQAMIISTLHAALLVTARSKMRMS